MASTHFPVWWLLALLAFSFFLFKSKAIWGTQFLFQNLSPNSWVVSPEILRSIQKELEKKTERMVEHRNLSGPETAAKWSFPSVPSGLARCGACRQEYSKLSPSSIRMMLGPEFHLQKSEVSIWFTNQSTRIPEEAPNSGHYEDSKKIEIWPMEWKLYTASRIVKHNYTSDNNKQCRAGFWS